MMNKKIKRAMCGLSLIHIYLQSGDQKYLAKELYGTSVACLKSWLRCITDLRNRCAHYSRLYYWSFPALPKMPRELETSPNRKLFSQILVLKLLYPVSYTHLDVYKRQHCQS